jgi:hypothetical protein
MNEPHIFRPTLPLVPLEDRVLPALVQVLPLSTLILASTGPPSSGPGSGPSNFSLSGINQSATAGSGSFGQNASLGLGFTSRYTSAYSINAGLGMGFGGFVGGSGLLGGGGGSVSGLLGGPSLSTLATRIGNSAGLATGPSVSGAPASGGESGVSPGPDPSGPQPTQVTPSPSGETTPPPGGNTPGTPSNTPPPPSMPALQSPARGVPTGSAMTTGPVMVSPPMSVPAGPAMPSSGP